MYFPITNEGKKFIHNICDKTGTSHLIGNNKGMPYTYPILNITWTSHALYKGSKITNGVELAEAIIDWYDYYSEKFGLDANVLAAQAYTESSYTLWTYAGISKDRNNPNLPSTSQSTASGLNQILSTTAFNLIIANNNNIYPFTTEEIAKITKGISGNTNILSTYQVGTYQTPPPSYLLGWYNRPIYHQNAIDNPDIMIKAQCAYMKHIADRCNSFTSSTIMCYYQGEFERDTYPKTIAAVQSSKSRGPQGASDGMLYILKIFGVLGDKNNLLSSQLGNYKPSGYYFGYDSAMDGINKSKNLKLSEPFTGYETTLG